MSNDEIRAGIDELQAAGRVPDSVARAVRNNPVESQKFIWRDRIDRAIFGDKHLTPPGVQGGLIADVYSLKIMVYQAKWMFVGGTGIISFLLIVLGILVEYSRH